MSRTNLDEKALRRPDFVPGSPVTLADGQTWFLRRPVVRFVPDDTHESGFQVRLTLAGEDRYAELMGKRDAILDSGPDVKLADIVGIELAIGTLLLRANYDLASDQVASLVQFGYDEDEDPEGAALRNAVLDVARGQGPKAQPAGCE